MSARDTLDGLHDELAERVAEGAARVEVPGVAVGILLGGEEDYVFHGVTSINDPLPIDEGTLFQIGSTGKTLTGTAIMALVERGDIELSAPVRRYIPELRLQDEDVAERVTVLHLLNHTSGWAGDFFADTGYGDDALERFIEKLAEAPQEHPLGERVSYSNSALTVAGRVIEKVTGKPFQTAIQELVFDPIGLKEHFYYPWDIMTRRYSAGHSRQGGPLHVTGWYESRSGHPQGGTVSASARDQIRYARFHMGDGWGVLRRETLEQMQTPTTTFGVEGAKGITWGLRDLGGERIVAHGGSTAGFQTGFEMVPAREFALVVHTNASHGLELLTELVDWSLEAYLGLAEEIPDPLPLTSAELAEYAGVYGSHTGDLHVSVAGDRLIGKLIVNAEMYAELGVQEDEEPIPPLPFKILPGDQFLVLEGPYKGMRGGLLRDAAGRVNALDLGRVFTRKE